MKSAAPLVLFVCEANVCRSPLAMRLFTHALTRAGLESDVRVASGGTQARPDLNPCSWALANSGDDPEEVEPQTPRQVTVRHLEEAALCLAADRQVMSNLIRLLPSARSHTFTMKQAAALAAMVVDDVPTVPTGAGSWRRTGLDDPGRCKAGSDARDIDWLTAEMDAARAWLPMEPGNRRFRRPRPWSRVLDVPDAHADGPARARHQEMLYELQPAVTSLSGSVVCVVGAVDRQP